jgi:hypothetical protein
MRVEREAVAAAVGFPEAFAAARKCAFPLLAGRLESYKKERGPIRASLRRSPETAKPERAGNPPSLRGTAKPSRVPHGACEMRMANDGEGVAQGLLTITA